MNDLANKSTKVRKYALITGAFNEEKLLEQAIQSVVSQTVLPVRWVIVDDSSTDRTPEIVEKYARQYDFIELLQLKDPHPRDFTAHVVAINAGFEVIKNLDYDFVGNLDADVSLEPDYFSLLMQKFDQDPRLGLAGGFLYEKQGSDFRVRKRNNTRSVPNAIQMFRRESYKEIGGYLPLKYGAPDWCAEVRVRMKGWSVQSFPNLKVLHLRHTGSVDGNMRNMFRDGLVAVYLGSHPFFEILKCIDRIPDSFLCSLTRLSGLIVGYSRREQRKVSKEFVQFLRNEQKHRMWAFLVRKFRRS